MLITSLKRKKVSPRGTKQERMSANRNPGGVVGEKAMSYTQKSIYSAKRGNR